jgi:predicted P-loop ATPase
MTKKLIICDDEFGGKSKKEAKLFKEILSKQAITIRKPYDRVSEDLTRLSVFCGTTNDEHILNDPTGNRRILPVQITGIHFEKMDKIDRTGLWIELYRLWKEDPNGFFLNSEEIATLNAYGRERFEETSIEKDVISHLMYLPAELESLRLESEEDFRYLLQTKRTIVSTSWIKKTGEDGNRFQLSTKKIGEQMKSLGFKQTSAPKSDPFRMIAYKQRGWVVVLR